MKNFRFTILIITMIINSLSANSQTLDNYTFSEISGNYTSISTTGTKITLGSNQYDDGGYDLDLSGDDFSFPFCGQTFSSLSVNTNGAIQLGGTNFNSRFNHIEGISGSEDLFPLIIPLWDDLKFINYDDDEGLYYELSGTGNQQILTIEWNNVARYYHAYDDCRVSFQIKLYEETGCIELIYGDMSGADNWNTDCTASIGINNKESDIFVYQSVTPGNPATVSSSTPNNSVTDTEVISLTPGTTYRFTPPPPPVYTITFVVSNSSSTPLQNVNININGTDITTNSDGIASTDLQNGTYDYTASLTGYDNSTGTVTVNDAAQTVNITLTETLYTTTFNVADENSAPLQNVNININGTDITTNSNGIASIDLQNGTYDYTASLTGYNNTEGTVTINNAIQNINIILDKITSINEISNNFFDIYPNPTSGIINIISNNKKISAKPYLITITDITGKIIKTKSSKNQKNTTINLVNKPNGIYIVKINSDNNTITKKIIKK